MSERAELFEAVLDSLPEGIALLSLDGRVVFWNRSAEAITGHRGADLVGRPVPAALSPLLPAWQLSEEEDPIPAQNGGRGALIHVQHKLGHSLAAMTQTLLLRDGLGGRIGLAVVFHPAESLDALPHGESSNSQSVQASQAEIEDRLSGFLADFRHGGPVFGVLWITVDQGHELRKTHGVGACETMLEKVERTLANGLRPTEALGRWGDDEYLIISHERTLDMLKAHAQKLAGLARTADFRWWGDRISLTVSIGAAQAEREQSLTQLLERAKAAMFTSFQAGGNQITAAPGGQQCLPS